MRRKRLQSRSFLKKNSERGRTFVCQLKKYRILADIFRNNLESTIECPTDIV